MLHCQSDHGNQPDSGHRAALGQERSDRQHRQPHRHRAPPRRPTPRSPPTSAPTTPTPAPRPPPKWANCCPTAERSALIGGTSGDVTSAARLDGFTKARARQPRDHLDRGRRLGTPDGTDQGDRHHDGQPDSERVLRRQRRHGPRCGAGNRQSAARPVRSRVISVDGNKDAFEAVKTGGIDAVVAQFPYVIGAMGVDACKAAIAGKTLPANVKAPVQVVTKANVDAALASAPKPAAPYDEPVRGARQMTTAPVAAARDDDRRAEPPGTPAGGPYWIPRTWPPGRRRSRWWSWRSFSRRSIRRS